MSPPSMNCNSPTSRYILADIKASVSSSVGLKKIAWIIDIYIYIYIYWFYQKILIQTQEKNFIGIIYACTAHALGMDC